jgi:hypothetical protein
MGTTREPLQHLTPTAHREPSPVRKAGSPGELLAERGGEAGGGGHSLHPLRNPRHYIGNHAFPLRLVENLVEQ